MEEVKKKAKQAILDLNIDGFNAILQRQIDEHSASLNEISDQVITPILTEIGAEWEEGKIALSQVYMAGRLIEKALSRFFSGKIPQTKPGRIAIAVLEDYHMLGKSIIASSLTYAGYAVCDLGTGVGVDELVKRTLEVRPDILMISVLMFNKALIPVAALTTTNVSAKSPNMSVLSPKPALWG